MTFDSYIKNPMGTGSSVMTNRLLYQKLYTEKWDALLVREDGNIEYKLYKENEDYYIHLKIPSETVPKFYYDIVIRFYLPKEEQKKSMERTLSSYSVQFYSNDPSFVYTFAYAFNKHNMFISDLESKMSKKALKEEPKVRNPKNEIGYVKTIYFAYIQIKRLNLMDKNRWPGMYTPYSKKVWKSVIEHADDKVQKRQELGEEILRKSKGPIKKKKGIVRKAIDKAKYIVSPNPVKFGHFKKTEQMKIEKPSKISISSFKKK